MAVWKVDGFEHGSVVSGTSGVYDGASGTPAIVTSPVRSGARALEITPSGAAAERVLYDFIAGVQQPAASFYIRFATLPTAVVTLAAFNNANGPGMFQFDNTAGRFAVSNNNAGRQSVGPTVATNTWYLIDLRYDSSTGTVTMAAAIDGGGLVTASRSQVASDATTMHLGTADPASPAYTAYYDDWVISDDYTADFPIAAHHIEALIASADGTHAVGSGAFDSFTTTAFTNGTTNGNTFIGHRPMQLANTAEQVIRQVANDVNAYMEFTLENLASGASTPIGVRTYGAAEEAGTGNSLGEIRLLLSDNTEVLTTGSLSVIDSTDTISNTAVSVFKREAIDPSGGWDRTKVDGLKIRLGFADGAPDVNFIDLMVEVALTEPAVDATPSTVAAVAALGTPTITLGTTALPSEVQAVAAVPTPGIVRTAVATPSTVAGVADVPTPLAVTGGGANANPNTVAAVAALPTPTITAITPTTFPDHYSDGYGQGYETIAPEPPVVVAPEPPPNVPTPTLRVLIDFEHDMSPATGPMPDPTFVDVTDRLRAQPVSVARGRKRLMDRIEAGQLSLVFDDLDRALDPANSDSPFYPGVGPDRRIRLEAVLPWETDAFTMCSSFVGGDDLVGGGSTFHYLALFDGLTDELTYAFPGARTATATVRCTDMLGLAARDEVGASIPVGDVTTGFHALLNTRAYMGRQTDPVTGAVLATSDLRDIDEDDTPVTATSAAGPITVLLDLLTASGGGNFYIAADGMPTYRSRSALDAPVKVTFAVEAERFRDVMFSFDNALLVNDVTVSGFVVDAFGANQPTSVHLVDEEAKQKHPARGAVTIETLISDFQVLNDRAREVLANQAFPIRYIQRLEVSQVSTDWQLVLNCDLWDRINLSVVLPNGDVVTQPSLIEGIEITTTNFRDWFLAWWLSVPPYRQMLDDADRSFENGDEGTFTSASTIESTDEAWATWHSGRNHISREGFRPLNPPLGAYALWVQGASVTSGAYAVVAGGTYLVEYKVLQHRFTAAVVEIPDYATSPGPFRLDLTWYDAAMVSLSTVGGTTVAPQAGGQQWTLLSERHRAPTGAAFVRITVTTTHTTHFSWFLDDGLMTRIVG